MRSERLCSLGRYLGNKSKDALDTYSAQWLERSLDDSAIRRISIPESYLCADACLILLLNVSNGLVVYEEVIKRRIQDELPFVSFDLTGSGFRGSTTTDGHREHHYGMRAQWSITTGHA